MKSLGVTEFTEYIAPDGSVYQFDTSDGLLMTEEGLGMPPIDYIAQQGPAQHGSSVLSYRLKERIIQLVIRNDACNRTDYWAHRAALLDAIRPNKSVGVNFEAGVLRKIFADGSIRDINVTIQEGPAFAARSLDKWDEHGFTETIRFIAHDPLFYDPIVSSVVFAFSTAAFDQLVFPITFPIEFDSSSIDITSAITYPGTWFAFPTIVLTGPQAYPKIDNLSTGEKIWLDYIISAGEVVTISLEYGNKLVTNNYGVNLIGVVPSDCDLATFHIAPKPEVTNGVNNIRYQSINNTAASSGVLSYQPRYMGI